MKSNTFIEYVADLVDFLQRPSSYGITWPLTAASPKQDARNPKVWLEEDHIVLAYAKLEKATQWKCKFVKALRETRLFSTVQASLGDEPKKRFGMNKEFIYWLVPPDKGVSLECCEIIHDVVAIDNSVADQRIQMLDYIRNFRDSAALPDQGPEAKLYWKLMAIPHKEYINFCEDLEARCLNHGAHLIKIVKLAVATQQTNILATDKPISIQECGKLLAQSSKMP